MPKEKSESQLTLDEMLQLATKVELWDEHKPKGGLSHLSQMHYNGCHKGVHVEVTYTYDPSIYEGSECTWTVSASVQHTDLGKYKYISRSEDGAKKEKGDKRIADFYDDVASTYKKRQPRISEEAAIRYARSLLSNN